MYQLLLLVLHLKHFSVQSVSLLNFGLVSFKSKIRFHLKTNINFFTELMTLRCGVNCSEYALFVNFLLMYYSLLGNNSQ